MQRTVNQQLELIKRGTTEIISEEELKKKIEKSIAQKKPLKVKAGFDPTAPDIHLGHSVLLRKLRHFQDLGHEVIFLIGDFTARIGDPSGRSQARKQLSEEEISENAATYKKQVFKILDPAKTRTVFNSKWFEAMTGLEFAKLLTHYTATRLLERDDFSLRIKEKRPLYMHELIYPILQGYDSVVLEADIELGGSDQKFNLLVGRELQRDFQQEPQVVLTMPLLEGTDGLQKMSKSYANYIGINESAKEIFGKVMSISDELMLKYYTLLTNEDLKPVAGMHPKEAKLRLAELIAASYHSREDARLAREEFERVFAAKELPVDLPIFKLTAPSAIIEVLLDSGLTKSKNEARRLIRQMAVSFNDKKIEDENFKIASSGIVRAGSRRFLKIELRR
jgi:tyrosyl-tRNA synthetase